MERFKYDIKWFDRELNRIGSPKRYRFPMKEILDHDYGIILSMRQDAGKTTTALLYGLLMNKKYKYPIEYIRNDDSQIRRAAAETLFNVILKHDYITKIYDGEWNTVVYHYMQHKFYLAKKDEEGNIIESEEPICILHSNEDWSDIKSSYNSPLGNYIIFDECLDTHRATHLLWKELMENISTIGRVGSDEERSSKCHVIILGNNTDRFGWIFQDFCISDLIPDLKYGTMIKFKTDMGTDGVVALMEQSDVQKERLKNKDIHFFGFNSVKAAQFIGTSEWTSKEYQHPDFYIDFKKCYFRRMYIFHRQRYIQLNMFFDDEHKKYIFLHFASEPLKKDNIILTLNPVSECDFYGICEYEDNKKVSEFVRKVFRLRKENRWYYQSNLIGEIVDDYLKSV